jgi:predicted Zn-dependent protease
MAAPRAVRALLLVLLAAILAAPPAASAGKGLRWADSTVTYRDKSKGADKKAVRVAIAWWNDAPGTFRFAPATGGDRADVTIRSVEKQGVGWDGLAEYALNRRGYISSATLSLNDVFLSDQDPEYVAEVAAHELGHAVGLPHLADDCSLMYPSGSVATRCPDGAGAGRFSCGPQPSDVKSLLARYGGRLGGWRGTTCNGKPPRSARAASVARSH